MTPTPTPPVGAQKRAKEQAAVTPAEKLVNWSIRWKLEYDLVRCKGCKLGLHISRRNESLAHAADCPHDSSDCPWIELADHISEGMPAEPVAVDWVPSCAEEVLSVANYWHGHPSNSVIENIAAIIRKHAESWTPPRPGEASRLDITQSEGVNYLLRIAEDFANHLNQLALHGTADRVRREVLRYFGENQPPASAAREWDVWVHPSDGSGVIPKKGDAPEDAWTLAGWTKIHVREVHPVTPEVPEGVPVPPDGFDYLGAKRLLGEPVEGDFVVWMPGWRQGWQGILNYEPARHLHKAIRRGTELHRRNFTP